MSNDIRFLSKQQLEQVHGMTTDPVVKALAEATLSAYELHLSLEKALLTAYTPKKGK